MKRFQIILALTSIFVLLKSVSACTYTEYPSVCDAYGSAEAIFAGSIKKIEAVKNLETFKRINTSNGKEETVFLDGFKYSIKVEKTYKGAPQSEILLADANTSCSVSRKVGDKLIFYVRFDKALQMWKFSTHRTSALEFADDDLLFLNGLPKTLNRTRISGRLYKDDRKGTFLLAWLSGVKLKIQGKNRTFETTTDKNGVYEIYDLPVGVYTIIPEISEGFILERPFYEAFGRIIRKLPTLEDANFGQVNLSDTRCIGVSFLYKPKKPVN